MTTAVHCLCQKPGWKFEWDKSWGCYCHCDDCRRICAAPVVARVGVPLENFKWTGTAPRAFERSSGVQRFLWHMRLATWSWSQPISRRDAYLRRFSGEPSNIHTRVSSRSQKQACLAEDGRWSAKVWGDIAAEFRRGRSPGLMFGNYFSGALVFFWNVRACKIHLW